MGKGERDLSKKGSLENCKKNVLQIVIWIGQFALYFHKIYPIKLNQTRLIVDKQH